MAAVRVDLQVGGIARVNNAMQSVKATVAKMEEASSKEAARHAARKQKIEANLAKERIRAEASVSKDMSRLQALEVKAASKAYADRLKASTTIHKELLKNERDLGKAARKEADDTAKAQKKSADDAAKAQKKAADDAARYIERVRHNSTMAAGRHAARQAAAEQREAQQRQRALASDRRGYLGAAGRGIGGALGGIAKLGGAALAIGGGFAMTDVVRGSLSNESAAIALSNSAYQPGKERLKPNDLLKMAGRVSSATGTDRGELLSGLQDYVALSGKPEILSSDEGETAIKNFAMLAKGSGASLGDILKSAGALATQNDNKDFGAKQQAEMLRNVVGQGKLGAVELPDLARVAGRVASGATQYSGTQSDNQRKLLALTQISRKTAGSADDAATAVQRFSSDVARNADKNGMSSRVFAKDDKGNLTSKLRDNADILAEYFLETKGNTVKMGEGRGNLGLGAEAIKVASAMSGTYETAVANARKDGMSAKDANKAGAEAVRAKVKEFEGAEYSENDVKDDFSAVMKGSAERMDASLKKITTILEDRAAPFIERLAASFERNGPKIEAFLNSDDFSKLLDQVSAFVEWLAGNPWKGLAAVVAASMAKEIALAGIAKLIKKAFEGAGGGGGGGGGGAGGGAGAGGTTAAGAIGAATTGFAAGTMAFSAGEEFFGADSSIDSIGKTDALTKAGSDVQALRFEAIAAGKKPSLTGEQVEAMRKRYRGAMELGQDAQSKRDSYGGWEKFTDSVGLSDHGGEIERQGSAAQSVIDQIRKLDEETGGQVSKKIPASDFVDTKALTEHTTSALQKGVDGVKFGNNPTDPNAPNRNTPQNQRPPA